MSTGPSQATQMVQGVTPDPQSTMSSVAQSNVAGDGLKCEWRGCGERLGTPEQLYDHVCERHVGRKSTNNLNLVCAWGNCTTTTVKRDHITSHIRVHVPLKPHKCDFCQKAFKRPQDLKKHVKTHAEDTSAFHQSPEPNRPGHGGPSGGFQGQAKHVADLQALAATASGYYGEHHGAPGQAPVYPPYPNGNANASAYHGPSHYQAGYATTFYQVPTLSNEYEMRKKATYDALNEFFGDIKTRSLDPGMYHAVGQRLMQLQNLPGYSPGVEYGAGTAVASVAAPLSNHYTLPMSNLRTKNDLQNIDQFLEQLQATVYEHESASQAALAGVAQAGSHYVHSGVNYRSSNSPPHQQPVQTTAHTLPPLTATSAETPALTPASSVLSYNSPGSVHSTAISPVSRATAGSMYPTLPSVTMPDVSTSYAATSSAVPSAVATSFDSDGRRRFSSGLLQRSRRDKESASPDSLPQIHRLGVRSPSLSNVDPALYGDEKTEQRTRSPIDPALFSAEGESRTGDKSPADADWIIKVRVLESIRAYIKERLEKGKFEDGDTDTVKEETEAEKDARSLYPVLRAVQDSN